MSKYMLLLHRNPTLWTSMSPDEMQKAIEKFVRWRMKLIELGILAGGEKLADDAGKVIRREQGQPRIIDGPYSEAKEILGGYFTIEAASYQEALEHCLDCPALDYDGTIEVRLIDEQVPKR
ncbi:MAG: YciI family protein [Blastocatellia bacterium]